MTPEINKNICEAIIRNLVSQRANPFDSLQRRYNLPISHVEFGNIKNRFIAILAKNCGFPEGMRDDKQDTFSKRDILAMLFAIAGEANDCIVKDGAFNHQVAGVALKAIDQAVRLSGMCESATTEDVSEITMDDPSQRLGA
jgi:hypothetical protein